MSKMRIEKMTYVHRIALLKGVDFFSLAHQDHNGACAPKDRVSSPFI